MKKTIILLVVVLLGVPGVMAQTKSKTRVLKPTGFLQSITIDVSGKPSQYYSLSSEQASVISVVGPGKLRVITRGRFLPKQPASKINYEIQYIINGGKPQKAKIAGAVRAEASRYADGIIGTPAQGKEIEIVLGIGSHTIEFLLPAKSASVEARYLFSPTKDKKTSWVSFCPLTPMEPVELIANESVVKYYRFSNEKPLKVEINGPTQLKIMSRVENHYKMKGRINYRIQVAENNTVLNTYQLSSTISETTSYRDVSKLIPGKACQFVIEVPKGKHVYELTPLDKDKKTVLSRLLIPEKDVKIGR